MVHNPPQFPLAANTWRWGAVQGGSYAQWLVGVRCQLHVRPVMFATTGTTDPSGPALLAQIYFPKGTDVGDVANGLSRPDLIECPAGSGCRYTVAWVGDIAKGFPNEFRIALVVKTKDTAPALAAQPWPLPIP